MITFFEYILYFSIYSFLGWVCECIYCSIPEGRFINRGFLTGPVCPVYGFGALLVLAFLKPVSHNAFFVFFFGMIVTSILEYLTSIALEKSFHMKWWDYSDNPFNINGRVCLLNSVLFGILSVFVTLVINPRVVLLINRLSLNTVMFSGIILSVIFITDTWISIYTTLQLSGKLEKIHAVLDGLLEKNRELFESKLLHRRILRAFPNLKSNRYHGTVERLREVIRESRCKLNKK